MSSHTGRVLLVEWEGASYDLLGPLAERGVMPRMAELLQAAALTELAPAPGLSEEAARATLWTGAAPSAHGMLDDHELDARRSRILPRRIDRLARPTLCQQVQAAFGPAAVQCIEDFDAADCPWQDAPADLAALRRRAALTQEALSRLSARAVEIDRGGQWRLLTVRLRTLQGLQYHVGNALQTGDRPGAKRPWIDAVDDLLHAMDRCLAELSRIAQERGATLVVASSSGVVPFRGHITLAELLSRAGLLRLRDGAGALGYRLRRLGWRARRLLGRRADASRPLDAVLPVDWRRTAAVALHGHAAALVYLNTPERFGARALATVSAQDRAAEAVVDALTEARHPASGEPLFVDVFRTDARFGDFARRHGWPEVIGVPAAGFQTRHRTDRKRRLVRGDRRQTGAIGGAGLLMIDSPEVAIGRHRRLALEEVAQRVLDLLDMPAIEDFAAKTPMVNDYVA